jgi:hypothetical protein
MSENVRDFAIFLYFPRKPGRDRHAPPDAQPNGAPHPYHCPEAPVEKVEKNAKNV